jgi:insertion element IS1 protein InsB
LAVHKHSFVQDADLERTSAYVGFLFPCYSTPLFERLARWKVRLFCSDSYVVYPLVLAVGGHYQGKGETVALERNNGQQRHWTAALRRRSIVVSKSLAMIERRVALFAHLHVNKDAAPEMYRLPIQVGGPVVLA